MGRNNFIQKKYLVEKPFSIIATWDARRWMIVGLVVTALVFRLFRIGELTEFLGDQGVAMEAVSEWFHTGSVPLVGPTVSTGQKPGAFYYYLLSIPLFVSGFHPLSPAIFFAILGSMSVLLLFLLLSHLVNKNIAYGTSLLLAVSPLAIRMDRTMWNPTSVSFFVLLVFYLLFKLKQTKHTFLAGFIGICVGGLLQLHYSNIITLLGVSIVLISGRYRRVREKKYLSVWKILFWFGLGFFAVLSPFLYYEYTHQLTDLREILLLTLYPEALSVIVPKGNFLNFYIPASRAWQFLVLVPRQVPFGILVLLLMSLKFIKQWWYRWLVIYFFFSSLYVSKSLAHVPDHYIYFLLPVVCVIFAGFVEYLRRFVPKQWVIVLLIVLFGMNVLHLDSFSKGVRDIPKTQFFSKQMIEKSNTRPYSFTLLSSRSFSDYHYRYFLNKSTNVPVYIDSKNYNRLYLICEAGICPEAGTVSTYHELPVLCFDKVCTQNYPHIFLNDWKLTDTVPYDEFSLYVFDRKIPFDENRDGL